MVFLTVDVAREVALPCKYGPSRSADAKAPMIFACCCFVKDVRKMSSSSPTDLQ